MTKSDNIDLGINFGFDKEKFFVEYCPFVNEVGNFRQEMEKRAVQLYNHFPNLTLCLSSGIDSQSVLHSFFSQGMKIDCAFLYQPGYNDSEYNNINILEKKYNFKTTVVEIHPEKVKDEVLTLQKQYNLPPNQILHKMFVEKLPTDTNILQGVHGPDFLQHENKWYIFESANSFEISRLRSLLLIPRNGKIIGFERTSQILYSLLDDEITRSFLYSYSYIKNNKLIYDSGETIPLIDYWDLYLKPFFYGKYWKDNLEYFPKYQGCEKIDYIINGPRNQYEKNLVFIPYLDLVNLLRYGSSGKKTFREYQ